MYAQEKVKPYAGKTEKGKMVKRMFDTISPTYDKLNLLMSLGIDRYWRNKLIGSIAPYVPDHILDVATGTGDLAILAAKRLTPKHVTGVDFSEGMMDIGRQKAAREGLGNTISFANEDCMNMSFANDTFDVVVAAFGIRNFQSLDKGLSEMCRVLKKGGRLSVIELTTPQRFPMKQLFALYSHSILPLYGRLISHNADAYQYLTKSIEAFPQGEQMVGILKNAGFEKASFKRLTCGICTLYLAIK